MKKITLLLSFIACVVFAQAQNLLVNPSFETWASGVPTGWTLTTTVSGTVSQATTTAQNQTGSALQVAGPTGTYTIQQNVVPPAGASTFDTNSTYKLSVSYLVTAGDGTDARVWSGLVTSAPNVTPITYYAVPTTHADSLITYIPIHGPGGNIVPASGTFGNDLNGYLLDNRTSAVWHTYNYSFKFPTGIAQFNFAVRQYSASTVIWDNFYFGIDLSAGVSDIKADALNVSLAGKSLYVKNVTDGSIVDVYSSVGSKVQSAQLVNGAIQLNNLSKGLYIVRIGNQSSKIIL